jgi:hypothetical protein
MFHSGYLSDVLSFLRAFVATYYNTKWTQKETNYPLIPRLYACLRTAPVFGGAVPCDRCSFVGGPTGDPKLSRFSPPYRYPREMAAFHESYKETGFVLFSYLMRGYFKMATGNSV